MEGIGVGPRGSHGSSSMILPITISKPSMDAEPASNFLIESLVVLSLSIDIELEREKCIY
jgi:hypothetical protein